MATNKVSTATGPLGYAAEKMLPPAVRAANAAFKALPPPVPVYVPRWEVWGAAFGGVNNTRGDNAAATSDLYTRVGGVAAGADYRFAPDSLIGFSLAGGNINWTVNGPATSGSGTSDTFMAGIYGKHGFGAGYLSGAATYTNYWMKTDRASSRVLATCSARIFEAESWGGRLEGGYRAGQYWAINWDAVWRDPGPELQDPELCRDGRGRGRGGRADGGKPDCHRVPRRSRSADRQDICRRPRRPAQPVRQIRLCA